MAAPVGSTALSWRARLIDNTAVPVVQEMMSTFPDALVITSGIFALLTLSMPFAVLFGSLVEATFVFHGLRKASTYLNAGKTGVMKPNPRCRTGYAGTTMSSLFTFGDTNIPPSFPSAPIFMLSTASAYLFGTLNAMNKELQALGPSYSSRYYVSVFFLFMLLLAFVAFRLLYGCESFGVIMLSIPIGIILGLLLVQQNMRLFGENSINLIGIPILRSRAADGKKIYVCPTQKS
jgi:hypothetical protein